MKNIFEIASYPNPHIKSTETSKKPFEVETNILPVPKNLTNSDNIDKKIAFPKKSLQHSVTRITLGDNMSNQYNAQPLINVNRNQKNIQDVLSLNRKGKILFNSVLVGEQSFEEFHPTQEYLADIAGLCRPTVCVRTTAMHKDGLIVKRDRGFRRIDFKKRICLKNTCVYSLGSKIKTLNKEIKLYSDNPAKDYQRLIAAIPALYYVFVKNLTDILNLIKYNNILRLSSTKEKENRQNSQTLDDKFSMQGTTSCFEGENLMCQSQIAQEKSPQLRPTPLEKRVSCGNYRKATLARREFRMKVCGLKRKIENLRKQKIQPKQGLLDYYKERCFQVHSIVQKNLWNWSSYPKWMIDICKIIDNLNKPIICPYEEWRKKTEKRREELDKKRSVEMRKYKEKNGNLKGFIYS